jgi:hypothetical protein
MIILDGVSLNFRFARSCAIQTVSQFAVAAGSGVTRSFAEFRKKRCIPRTGCLLVSLVELGTCWELEPIALAGPMIIHCGDRTMSGKAKTDSDASMERPAPPDDKNNVVITPAGPVPREKVHPVGPNEIIRRNEDGTYTIVPKSDSKDKEPDTSSPGIDRK